MHQAQLTSMTRPMRLVAGFSILDREGDSAVESLRLDYLLAEHNVVASTTQNSLPLGSRSFCSVTVPGSFFVVERRPERRDRRRVVAVDHDHDDAGGHACPSSDLRAAVFTVRVDHYDWNAM